MNKHQMHVSAIRSAYEYYVAHGIEPHKALRLAVKDQMWLVRMRKQSVFFRKQAD